MYENACEFLTKADNEGGLAELVLGYGVSPIELPDDVGDAAEAFVVAFERLRAAVNAWHGSECDPDFIKEYGGGCPR